MHITLNSMYFVRGDAVHTPSKKQKYASQNKPIVWRSTPEKICLKIGHLWCIQPKALPRQPSSFVYNTWPETGAAFSLFSYRMLDSVHKATKTQQTCMLHLQMLLHFWGFIIVMSSHKAHLCHSLPPTPISRKNQIFMNYIHISAFSVIYTVLQLIMFILPNSRKWTEITGL